MKTFQPFLSLLLMIALCAGTALAQGNNAPNGAHYNLNIIGVEKGKTAPMTGTNRHTIFVALGKGEAANSRIYLVPGDFTVCDGNGFDAAFDCNGTQIQSQGAVFRLPCNNDPALGATACTVDEQAKYAVYARAVGTPGGSATITTCAMDKATNEVVCSTSNQVAFAFESRTFTHSGKPSFENVTKELTTLCFDSNLDGICDTRLSLFDDKLINYFWSYDNNGLRLLQIRFYTLP